MTRLYCYLALLVWFGETMKLAVAVHGYKSLWAARRLEARFNLEPLA